MNSPIRDLYYIPLVILLECLIAEIFIIELFLSFRRRDGFEKEHLLPFSDVLELLPATLIP